MSQPLVDALRTSAAELNAASAARLLADPFWNERYGDRSRKFAYEDGNYHLQYLVQALAAGDPGVMVQYARWLRSVLVPRGMCSEHLADNFRLLAAGIAAQEWPDRALALDVLARAEDALVYDAPAGAGELQRRSPELVQTIVEAVGENLPAVPARAEVAHDVRHLLSYLADALALGAPTTLAAHIAWSAGFMQRRLCPPGYLAALLEALHDAADPARFGSDARAYLAPLRAELAP